MADLGASEAVLSQPISHVVIEFLTMMIGLSPNHALILTVKRVGIEGPKRANENDQLHKAHRGKIAPRY